MQISSENTFTDPDLDHAPIPDLYAIVPKRRHTDRQAQEPQYTEPPELTPEDIILERGNEHARSLLATDKDPSPMSPIKLAVWAMQHKIEVQTHRATHDKLTKILNREGEEDALRDREKRIDSLNDADKPKATLLFFIDGNDFGIINKKHGNRTGDEVLVAMSGAIAKAAAGALEESFRQDDIVCRFGGDEFRVVVDIYSDDNTSLAEAIAAVTERIKSALEQIRVSYNGLTLDIAGSAGIEVIYGYADTERIQQSFNEADVKMQAIKAERKRQVAEQRHLAALARGDLSGKTTS